MKTLHPYLLVLIGIIIQLSCFAQDKKRKIQVEEVDSVYTFAEQMPTYPSGEVEMHRFIYNNLWLPDLKPEIVAENSKTSISFIVTKSGEIIDVKATSEKYEGKMITDSLISIIKRMPKWIPGKHNGKNVDVYYKFPIHIRFKSDL